MKNEEKFGERLLFAEIALYSMFPIIINTSTKVMPPILFAALSILVSAVCFYIYLIATKQLKKVWNMQALKYIILITIFILVLPSVLIYSGTKLTSGVNTAIFLQMEIFAMLIFCHFFFNEKITHQKFIGSILICIGGIIVLYNGSFQFNIGELMIIAGTVWYPIGNLYAKKALKIVPSTVILFVRSLLGGALLLAISMLLQENVNILFDAKFIALLPYIIINGVLIMFFSKILWYEALKRLEINKATSLAMSYPIFSVLFAMMFVGEIPTIYQVIGLSIIMIGVYKILKKQDKKVQLAEI